MRTVWLPYSFFYFIFFNAIPVGWTADDAPPLQRLSSRTIPAVGISLTLLSSTKTPPLIPAISPPILALGWVSIFPYPLPEAVNAPKSNWSEKGRNGGCSRRGVKACRERLRRERLNDKFHDLSLMLEPGRSVKTEKPAILDDAIRVLTQHRAESQELRETNEKLLEEIKCLKAEKNELKGEKLALKEDKQRLEQQLKAVAVPQAGFVPTHQAAAYHAIANKVQVFPSYGYYPMWRFLPPSTCDTSSDHELRPPAA